MRAFTVGTRGSALALWQTRHVSEQLRASASDKVAHGPVVIDERIITTKGDVNQSDRLVGKLEKGFFTEELEVALRGGAIDWAVHSLKDLPTRQPNGLVLGAILPRASPADLLILRPEAVAVGHFPAVAGARIGSCSLRREALLRAFAPTCTPTPLRGNVPTRLEKLKAGQFEGILLAEAGLSRLNLSLEGLVAFRLDPRQWVPAPGQGAVAVQCRENDAEVRDFLGRLDDLHTARAVTIERSLLSVLEGGCSTPFGALVEGETVSMGLSTSHGFAVRHSTVPAAPSALWYQNELATLHTTPQETSHEWLARRL